MSSCGPSGLPKIWRALRGLLGQYQGDVTQDHGTTITAEKPPSLLTILIIIPQKVPRSIHAASIPVSHGIQLENFQYFPASVP